MDNGKTITLRVPEEIDKALKQAAKAEYSSKSAIIRRTLAKSLLLKEKGTRETVNLT